MVLRSMLTWLVGLSMALLFTSAMASRAHEIRPTIADIEIGQDAVTIRYRITLEPLLAGINLDLVDNTNDAPEAAIYDQLRALAPARLEQALRADWARISQGFLIFVDGDRLMPEIANVQIPATGDVERPRDSILTVTAALPEGGAPVEFGLAAGYGTFVPREISDRDDAYEGFLAPGQLTPALPRASVPSPGAIVLRSVGAGVQAMVPYGLDHAFFVLGLVFFASQIGTILWQVGAFTAAHAVTFALATSGALALPERLTGAIVAASLIYVGVSNAVGWSGLRLRVALVFLFGLVHGLAFADRFTGLVIAPDRLAQAAGFLIGIELGQLAVLAAATLSVGWFASRDFYRPFIAVPASLAIAAIGAYWLVERSFF